MCALTAVDQQWLFAELYKLQRRIEDSLVDACEWLLRSDNKTQREAQGRASVEPQPQQHNRPRL